MFILQIGLPCIFHWQYSRYTVCWLHNLVADTAQAELRSAECNTHPDCLWWSTQWGGSQSASSLPWKACYGISLGFPWPLEGAPCTGSFKPQEDQLLWISKGSNKSVVCICQCPVSWILWWRGALRCEGTRSCKAVSESCRSLLCSLPLPPPNSLCFKRSRHCAARKATLESLLEELCQEAPRWEDNSQNNTRCSLITKIPHALRGHPSLGIGVLLVPALTFQEGWLLHSVQHKFPHTLSPRVLFWAWGLLCSPTPQ